MVGLSETKGGKDGIMITTESFFTKKKGKTMEQKVRKITKNVFSQCRIIGGSKVIYIIIKLLVVALMVLSWVIS